MVFRKAVVPRRYNVKTELRFDVPTTGSKNAGFDLNSDLAAK